MSPALWFALGILLGLIVGGLTAYFFAQLRFKRLSARLLEEAREYASPLRLEDRTHKWMGSFEEGPPLASAADESSEAAEQSGAGDAERPDWMAALEESGAPAGTADEVPGKNWEDMAEAGEAATLPDQAEGGKETAEKGREELYRLVETLKQAGTEASEPEMSGADYAGSGYSLMKERVWSSPEPAQADLVHFSVTSLPAVLAGSSFLLDVWAHLDSQREEILRRAREELGSEKIAARTKGPVKVARGTELIISAEIEGMEIDESIGSIDWEGEIGKADFFVDVPADAQPGTRKGTVKVYVKELPLVEIKFLIAVGDAAVEAQLLPVEARRIKSAFASYSSKDRVEVFERIQGIHKVVPDLDVFVDVDSLRSGDDWEAKLWEQIMDRDIFYLFWSANALNSEWVEKEWRFALKKRGLDFIEPVPLVLPDEAPPPKELASKHFNDKELIYIKAYSMDKSRLARIQELEVGIADLESELARIGALLENPPADPARVDQLGKDYVRVQGEMDALLREWEKINK